MGDWPEFLARVAALDGALRRIQACPDDVEARFDQARMLTLLGRREEAKDAYLELLRHAPAHFGALNNLGILLNAMGFRTAARTAYLEAVARHPRVPAGHVNLGNLLRDAGELDAAQAHYEAVFALEPGHTEAHKGMALLLLERGEEDAARVHQLAGYREGAVTVLPYRGAGEPVPILLLVSAAKGNAPFPALLDDEVFLATVMVTEHAPATEPLPPHRLVLNAIGDADLCGPALRTAELLASRSGAPVLNAPAAVLRTGRADNAERLAGLEGVRTPATRRLPRADLDREAALALGFSFPFLVRVPGFHTGQHFRMVASEADLEEARASLPGRDLWLIEHLDARGTDGLARKFRVMAVGGRLFPAHLAVSRQWKVHYFTSDMAGAPALRSEEEAFLRDMPAVLGDRAMRALEGIRDTLGLDYAGIDFGLDREGRVLLFEANAAMSIFPPEAEEHWAYRREPIARILEAARRLPASRLR